MARVEEEVVIDAAGESFVIGAAIADAEARKSLVHRLSADEFLVPRHAVIWRVLRRMVDSGLGYDPGAARKFLREDGAESDDLEYLGELEAAAQRVDNLDWYVETIAWDATRARVLRGSLPELLKRLRDPQADANDVRSAARAVTRALEEGGRRYVHRPAELYRGYRAEIAARRATRQVYHIGVDAVDRHLSEGMMPGRTHLWAGLPGSGKSTVVGAWLILLAKMGRRPMYCAWEMRAYSIMDVLVAHVTGIELTRVIQGDVTDEEAWRIDKASAWITKRIRFMGNPFFDRHHGGKASNDRNFDILEGYLAESGCDVAVYDLWARMLRYNSPGDVDLALYRMQALHEEYGICGVLLHHLHVKDVEKRADKRPTRDAIKGVSGYVEVPDMIIGIHRDAQFKAVDDNGVETICLKQRKGEANWAVRWEWDGKTARVANPKEVPFDPGLEAVSESGDIGRSIRDTSQIKTGKSRRRIGRRE